MEVYIGSLNKYIYITLPTTTSYCEVLVLLITEYANLTTRISLAHKPRNLDKLKTASNVTVIHGVHMLYGLQIK